MLAWVYLTDYLAHRRLLDVVLTMDQQACRNFLKSLDGDLWTRLDRSLVDPHYQLSISAYEPAAILACVAAEPSDLSPTFVELGSTFFASKTKFEIFDYLARRCIPDWPQLQLKWIGIDNSRFMHDTTRALHGANAVTLLDDYKAMNKINGAAFFLSRFVPSYVFSSSFEFAEYLSEHFQIALIEDAYSTTAEDRPSFNHGQAEIYFSIPATMARLEKTDFEIYMLDTYPEFPAGSGPCHVIRYLALKKGILTERTKERLRILGLDSIKKPISAELLLDQLNSAVTPDQWRAVEKFKRESPVWGRTPEVAKAGAWKSGAQAVKELFSRYFRHPAWRRHRLGGTMAIREIDRAVRAEKP